MKRLIDADEAIDHFRRIIDATNTDSGYNEGFIDALEFCISTLSTMPSAQLERKKGENRMDDLISRQAAIDVIKTSRCLVNALKKTMKLPSAQQEQKTAHWVPLDERFPWSDYFKCSECGFRINLRTVTDFSGQSVDYCPHCGLQMEGEK